MSDCTCGRFPLLCPACAEGWDKAAKLMKLGEPRTTDYCKKCGDSPESASHLWDCKYEDPRL